MNSAKWKTVKEIFSATLDLPKIERKSFLLGCDAEIGKEVENLLAAHFEAENFISDPFFIEKGIAEDETKDSFTGTKIENYLILEKLGAGGMGAVYLANRVNSDFKQKVALKIIKRGMDSDTILKRFATERRILSTLKHPNIAQLIDGGISSAGLPFFVMEFIDGKPLNEFCRENTLTLKTRLEIFRQICAAVEHAHKNLVIHRDLKPSNVLIAKDGNPKLLDFGIAKLLSNDDPSDATTAAQEKMFTPEYASPEQILGGNVTTATDIYSLGVILYELLAEQRPFNIKGKSFEEIIKSICETEPPKPSETKQNPTPTNETNTQTLQIPKNQLRGDLDNIVLKALRKNPSERYGSVQQFSEDISRFLRGLPVSARPQTVKYRFEKYLKRHKAGVFAAALIMFSLIGGISVALWQTIVARSESARAERQFADTRKLANSMLFEIDDTIRNLPGSTPAREKLVSNALEYLDKLAGEKNSDPILLSELADGYEKIGDIQGGGRTSHLGKRDAAIESYRKSLAIRENLAETNPQTEFFHKLADIYRKIGLFIFTEGNMAVSLEMHEKALQFYQRAFEADADNLEIAVDYAVGQADFGRMAALTGNTEKSVESASNAIKLLEDLNAKNPDNKMLLESLSYSYQILAEIESGLLFNYPKALEITIKGNEISEKLLAFDLQNTTFRRNVAAGRNDISALKVKVGDFKSALENSGTAFEMFSLLVKEDPQNEEFKQILATAELDLGDRLILVGRASEGITHLEKVLNDLREMYAASPKEEVLHFRIAVANEAMGKGYFALGNDNKIERNERIKNLREAKKYFESSYEVLKDYRDRKIIVGEEAARVDAIAENIDRCNQTIKQISNGK